MISPPVPPAFLFEGTAAGFLRAAGRHFLKLRSEALLEQAAEGWEDVALAAAYDTAPAPAVRLSSLKKEAFGVLP